MKGKVWKRIRGSENKNWGNKTSFSNVISPLVTGLVSIGIAFESIEIPEPARRVLYQMS